MEYGGVLLTKLNTFLQEFICQSLFSLGMVM